MTSVIDETLPHFTSAHRHFGRHRYIKNFTDAGAYPEGLVELAQRLHAHGYPAEAESTMKAAHENFNERAKMMKRHGYDRQ